MDSPVFDACKEADLPKLKQIVQGKPTSLLDTSGNFGATPLHVACLKGNLDIVVWIVEKDASTTKLKNPWGGTPLHYACMAIDLSSRGEMVAEYLIMQMDPEWTDVDGSTLLHFACRYVGRLELVKYLIEESKCDPWCVDQYGQTPLDIARSYGRTDAVFYLMEVPFNPDCTTKSLSLVSKPTIISVRSPSQIQLLEHLQLCMADLCKRNERLKERIQEFLTNRSSRITKGERSEGSRHEKLYQDTKAARDSGRENLDPINSASRTGRDSVPDYDAVDSSPLSVKALYRVNSEVAAVTDWYSLGIALNLSPSTLEQIGASCKDPARRLTEVLVTWLRQDQTARSWKSLVTALMSPTANRADVARKIAAVHCKSSSEQLQDFPYQEVDGTLLEESSLATIMDSISTLTTEWFHLGLALGLSYNTLRVIEFDHPGDSRECLLQMLVAWLKMKDMVAGVSRSQPSWRALASALSSPLVRRVEIATMITIMHPTMPLH